MNTDEKIEKLTSDILTVLDNTEHVTVMEAITAIAMALATVLAASVDDANMNKKRYGTTVQKL